MTEPQLRLALQVCQSKLRRLAALLDVFEADLVAAVEGGPIATAGALLGAVRVMKATLGEGRQ
jgi:hypothetical protein